MTLMTLMTSSHTDDDNDTIVSFAGDPTSSFREEKTAGEEEW